MNYNDNYQAYMAMKLLEAMEALPHGVWSVRDPEDAAFPELKLIKGGNDERE